MYNFTHDAMGTTLEDLMTIKTYTDEGYVVPIGEFYIDYSELDNVIKAIKSTSKNTKVYDFNRDKRIFLSFKNEKHIVDVSGDENGLYVVSYHKSLEVAEDFYKKLLKFNPPSSDNEINLKTFILTNSGVDVKTKIYKLDDYKNITNIFYPYLDTDTMFEQFFGHKESILILCGKPGVGKSKLAAYALKYALANIDKISTNKTIDGYNFINVGYVKTTNILAMDQFWDKLNKDRFDLVILDDLDFFLTSRNNEVRSQEDELKNAFLSQLLSFTDGIQDNKTKFIITSNQPFEGIDEALLRKGRLFDILELRDLKKSEALKIWKEYGLSEDEFNKCNFKNNILQADLGSEIQKRLNKNIKLKSYLKEENISKINVKPKKLGF